MTLVSSYAAVLEVLN